ncbi:MAG: hypothetical protein JWN70_793 [Planctomycetaceae bacterium]|nr:hypothetical protein [Planctomycetaceae bacterium]
MSVRESPGWRSETTFVCPLLSPLTDANATFHSIFYSLTDSPNSRSKCSTGGRCEADYGLLPNEIVSFPRGWIRPSIPRSLRGK